MNTTVIHNFGVFLFSGSITDKFYVIPISIIYHWLCDVKLVMVGP